VYVCMCLFVCEREEENVKGLCVCMYVFVCVQEGGG
jgi:hypothetical protein